MIKCTFEDGEEATLRHVVVDTLVLDGEKILLVKRTGKLLEGGKWGVVGGFTSRDETLKETAAREVLEETGYKVKDTTPLTVIDNPNRPKEDRQNISFVFFCTALEKVGEKDWESDEVKWFDLDNLPDKSEIAFDHLDMINLYKEYKKKPFNLPKF